MYNSFSLPFCLSLLSPPLQQQQRHCLWRQTIEIENYFVISVECDRTRMWKFFPPFFHFIFLFRECTHARVQKESFKLKKITSTWKDRESFFQWHLPIIFEFRKKKIFFYSIFNKFFFSLSHFPFKFSSFFTR